MKKLHAIQVLAEWDQKGKFVFTKHALRKFFHKDNDKSFDESLSRLVKAGILERVYRGVYINPNAHSIHSYVIEEIAKVLRPGEYNYVSLESMLSEYGVISQVLLDRLTVMTTGRQGVCKTPYGTVEFTHTKRPLGEIIKHLIKIKNRPLNIVSKQIAFRDLKRVGRNINLIDIRELKSEN